MKAHTTREKLRNAVARAEKVTGKNLSLPVLRCVLIMASGKDIRIRATNLDVGVELQIPAKIEKEGLVAVPGDILATYLATGAGDAPVILSESNGNLIVSSEGTKATIKSFSSDDFPILPSVHGGTVFTFAVDDIVRGLRSVSYSASFSSIKQELQSIYIHHHDGAVVFVATDSFRLAEKHIHDRTITTFKNILIPLKSVSEIIRNLEGNGGRVEVTVGTNQISFSGEGCYITSRLIDGTFPDYQQIIPKSSTTEVVLLKSDFINALKVSTIFSNTFNQVTFSIHPNKKHFSIESCNADVGESDVAVSGALSGDEVTINFNHRYLVDALQSISSDSLVLSLSGAGKPMVIRGVGDASFTYLVMPMNR